VVLTNVFYRLRFFEEARLLATGVGLNPQPNVLPQGSFHRKPPVFAGIEYIDRT
jgi:hypothetical protein